MKAAVTLLFHLVVLLCLSGTAVVRGQGGTYKFLWNPETSQTTTTTSGPVDGPSTTDGPAAGDRMDQPMSTGDLWTALVDRLESRSAAIHNDVWVLQAKTADLQKEVSALRTQSTDARRAMARSFNHSLTDLQTDLTSVWTYLNHEKASRSAFSVSLNDAENLTCVGPEPKDIVVVYKYVFINLGDGYSTKTGMFTVAISGVYFLSLTVYSNAGGPFKMLHLCVKLMVNGVAVINPSENYRQDQEDSTTSVLSMHLYAGDQVYVVLPAGCIMCDSKKHLNIFTGFLLYYTD